MSCPPQEQEAGKTHLKRCLYLRKVFTLLPLSLLILWLANVISFIFTQRELGLQEVLLSLLQITQRGRKRDQI